LKIQVLRKSDFPSNDFFSHIEKGTTYYQNRDFGRAVEEWGAASRLNYGEPIYLRDVEGRIFCGSVIEEVPFLFFLYALFINKTTGVGLIKTEGMSKKVVFRKGNLVFAATTRKEERIGSFILKIRKLTPEQLETLAGEARAQGKKLGTYLVERKLISAKALQELLTLQVQEILSDSLSWKKGHFYFVEKAIAEESVVNYSPLKGALISAQRGFNFTRFRKEIPDNRIIFRPSPYVEEDKDRISKSLNANEEFVLSLIDGVRNIDQLISFSGTDEVSLMNILYRLSSKGLIRRSKEVGEYEDKEFGEISKILKLLFEIYRLITNELIHEMGVRGKSIIDKAKDDLKASHQVIFINVPLEDPNKLNIGPILRNIASYFPSPNQRFVFMEAFHGLYVNILDELKKFLGTGLTEQTISKIERLKSDIEAFSEDTALKSRSMEILDEIVKKYS
jgi:hypothetical protein